MPGAGTPGIEKAFRKHPEAPKNITSHINQLPVVCKTGGCLSCSLYKSNANFADAFSVFAAAVFGDRFIAAIYAVLQAGSKDAGKLKEDTVRPKKVKNNIGKPKIYGGNAAMSAES